MKSWAEAELKKRLVGIETDFGTGVVRVTALEKLEGDASITLVRGRARCLFELSFNLKYEAKIGGRSTSYKGILSVADASNQIESGELPVFTNDWTDEGKAPAELRRKVRDAVGRDKAGVCDGLCGLCVAELRAFDGDFKRKLAE